ncbi:MAG: hypothetical protein JW942_06100 [Opitutales bacterium]|nr:hypothetical protein [Opitutales bacterium]
MSSKLSSGSSAHEWSFFRAGGVVQANITKGEDIANLAKLDLKLWFALAMPVKGVRLDPKFLQLIDADNDGRIRPPEVIAAARWAESVFANLDDLFSCRGSIALAAIRDAEILDSAKYALESLGKADADEISLGDIASVDKSMAATLFNGDGVIPASDKLSPAIKLLVQDILTVMGGVTDRSGAAGVDTATADAFYAQADAYLKWLDSGRADAVSIQPCGDATADALAALNAVKTKVDDFFARVRLANYDARALEAINRSQNEYLELAAKDMTISAEELAGFPVALVAPGAALPLAKGLNPAWEGAIHALRDKACAPLLGAKLAELSESEWARLKAALAPFEKWQAARPVTAMDKLGEERARAILASGERDELAALMAKDLAQKPKFDRIESVEKMLRFRQSLVPFLHNYVSFSQFYKQRRSAFIAGDLYLDARACHLCMDVADAGKHAALAGLSGIYLAYCDATRNGIKRNIVAAFTDGDSDNLMVGRNGVFYDRDGLDWDATITKVVANPISVREAFWSPYKKFQKAIEDMIAKRAASAEAASSGKLTNVATSAVNMDKQKQDPAAAPKKFDVGVIAAMAVALGAIGGALSSLATGLMGLKWWQIPLVFVGLVLLISLPSMILAWMKLKRRNIAPLLDANGWAVNTRARINTPFGAAMTDRAQSRAKISTSGKDPFADKKSRWPYYLVIIVALGVSIWGLNRSGLLHKWSHGAIGSTPDAECVEEVPLVQVEQTGEATSAKSE